MSLYSHPSLPDPCLLRYSCISALANPRFILRHVTESFDQSFSSVRELMSHLSPNEDMVEISSHLLCAMLRTRSLSRNALEVPTF